MRWREFVERIDKMLATLPEIAQDPEIEWIDISYPEIETMHVEMVDNPGRPVGIRIQPPGLDKD